MLQPCRGHAISMDMENAETTAPVASRQRAHRPAVSNGTRLFCVDGLDGRSQTARRFRDLVETIGNDLGGVDHLSEGQKQARRGLGLLGPRFPFRCPNWTVLKTWPSLSISDSIRVGG